MNTNVITQNLGKAKLLVKKHTPEILTAVAVVSTIGAVASAIHATMTVEDVISEHREKREKIARGVELIEEGEIDPEDYPEEAQKKDLVICYTQTVVKLAKKYALCAAFTGVSVASVLSLYKVLSARYTAVLAAYTGVQTAFDKYREVVREKLDEEDGKGTQFDRDVYETVSEKIVKDAEERKKISKRGVCSKWGPQYSMYARWFDERSPYFQKDGKRNLLFLRSQQNHANDLLMIRGHVFLNEVYDMLGLPRTKEGAIVGWVVDSGREEPIDFGIYNEDNPTARDFLNMWEKALILDFNVDGVIYNYI